MYDWAVENGKLLTQNWSLYDQQHHVLRIPGASPQEIDDLYGLAYRSFYHRPRFIFRRLLMIRSVHDIRSAFRAARMTMKAHSLPRVEGDKLEAELEEQYLSVANRLNPTSRRREVGRALDQHTG